MPHLFSPLDVGPITLPNRIAVAPMCQYSADDGSATDWHLQHLMQLAIGRAGLVMLEATGVNRTGRISQRCLGIYSDDNEAAIARVVKAARSVAAPGTRFGIQIAHAGRKASTHVPWEGGKPLGPGDGAWQTVAPSAVPFFEGGPPPAALDTAGLAEVKAAFCQAAERATRAGLEVIELHAAHGYLLHEFVSPLSNRRTDQYGGSLENRMRFPLEVASAVRAVTPKTVAMGARITGTDWADGGLTADDAVPFAAALKKAGYDYVCVTGRRRGPQHEDCAGPGLSGADGRQGEGRHRHRHARGRADRRARASGSDHHLRPGRFRRPGAGLPRRSALGVARGRAPRCADQLSPAVRTHMRIAMARSSHGAAWGAGTRLGPIRMNAFRRRLGAHCRRARRGATLSEPTGTDMEGPTMQTTSVGERATAGIAPVPGQVIFETTLPPRGKIAREIERGQIMRVVDLEGRQVGDLVAFNRANLAEKFWISNTVRLNGTVFVTTGHVLYSELSNPMFTITGRHLRPP